MVGVVTTRTGATLIVAEIGPAWFYKLRLNSAALFIHQGCIASNAKLLGFLCAMK